MLWKQKWENLRNGQLNGKSNFLEITVTLQIP